MKKVKQLLERFKRVFTVKEWKQEAQDAMRKKEFIIESLQELHRVEREENNYAQDRNRYAQQVNGRQNVQSYLDNRNSISKQNNKHSESSLKELMDAIKMQQMSV